MKTRKPKGRFEVTVSAPEKSVFFHNLITFTYDREKNTTVKEWWVAFDSENCAAGWCSREGRGMGMESIWRKQRGQQHYISMELIRSALRTFAAGRATRMVLSCKGEIIEQN